MTKEVYFEELKERDTAEKVKEEEMDFRFAKQKITYCPSCNHSIMYGMVHQAKFCPNCGKRLDWSDIAK